MEKFNLNGVDYKIVNGMVHEVSRGVLTPCYKGDSSVLDEYCRTRNLALYARPKGPHAYGSQEGQRAKTLANGANLRPTKEQFSTFQAYQHFLFYIDINDIKEKEIWGAHLTNHFAEKFSGFVARTDKGYAAIEAIVNWIQEMTPDNQRILMKYIIENHSDKW